MTLYLIDEIGLNRDISLNIAKELIDAAAYLNGQNIVMDGGYLVW